MKEWKTRGKRSEEKIEWKNEGKKEKCKEKRGRKEWERWRKEEEGEEIE